MFRSTVDCVRKFEESNQVKLTQSEKNWRRGPADCENHKSPSISSYEAIFCEKSCFFKWICAEKNLAPLPSLKMREWSETVVSLFFGFCLISDSSRLDWLSRIKNHCLLSLENQERVHTHCNAHANKVNSRFECLCCLRTSSVVVRCISPFFRTNAALSSEMHHRRHYANGKILTDWTLQDRIVQYWAQKDFKVTWTYWLNEKKT